MKIVTFRKKTYTRELLVVALEAAFPNIDEENAVYIGITNEPEQRLNDHNVDEDDFYQVYEANSRETAKEVEKYLLDSHPYAVGDTGGGNDDSVFVYAFNWNDKKHKK